MNDEQHKALREPFPTSMIGQLPKGNVKLDYVGHGAVTARLLEVDPEWSWEPLALDEDGLPKLDKAGNLWIKLTIGGVTRLGVGDGGSMKELIGDALRNAAMRFGVALDLWIRGQGEDDERFRTEAPSSRIRPPAPNPKAAPLAERLGKLPEDAQAKIIGWFKVPVNEWPGESDKALTDLAGVIERAEQKLAGGGGDKGPASTPHVHDEGGEAQPPLAEDPPASAPDSLTELIETIAALQEVLAPAKKRNLRAWATAQGLTLASDGTLDPAGITSVPMAESVLEHLSEMQAAA